MQNEFFWIFLPYGMEVFADNSIVVFNRWYQPLGFIASGQPSRYRFDGPPKRVQFKKPLTVEFLKSIDIAGAAASYERDCVTVWFYDDESNPFNWYRRKSEKLKMQEAYFARLTKLCEFLKDE